MDDPCRPRAQLPSDVADTIRWIATTSAEEVRLYREGVTRRIEEQGVRLKRSGACEKWLRQCDGNIQTLCAGVNGPLMEALIQEVGHCDEDCTALFRQGASFVLSLASHILASWQARHCLVRWV